MSITKIVFFFIFSVSLAPFSVFRVQNLIAVNYQNLGKTLKKKKRLLYANIALQTLYYGHKVIGIILWIL